MVLWRRKSSRGWGVILVEHETRYPTPPDLRMTTVNTYSSGKPRSWPSKAAHNRVERSQTWGGTNSPIRVPYCRLLFGGVARCARRFRYSPGRASSSCRTHALR